MLKNFKYESSNKTIFRATSSKTLEHLREETIFTRDVVSGQISTGVKPNSFGNSWLMQQLRLHLINLICHVY